MQFENVCSEECVTKEPDVGSRCSTTQIGLVNAIRTGFGKH